MEDDAEITADGRKIPLGADVIHYRNEFRELLPEHLYKALDDALGAMYTAGELQERKSHISGGVRTST